MNTPKQNSASTMERCGRVEEILCSCGSVLVACSGDSGDFRPERVPYGTPVTVEKLTRTDRAESALKALGFRQCRVRDHGRVARI